jgi:hypothetical protein
VQGKRGERRGEEQEELDARAERDLGRAGARWLAGCASPRPLSALACSPLLALRSPLLLSLHSLSADSYTGSRDRALRPLYLAHLTSIFDRLSLLLACLATTCSTTSPTTAAWPRKSQLNSVSVPLLLPEASQTANERASPVPPRLGEPSPRRTYMMSNLPKTTHSSIVGPFEGR